MGVEVGKQNHILENYKFHIIIDEKQLFPF